MCFPFVFLSLSLGARTTTILWSSGPLSLLGGMASANASGKKKDLCLSFLTNGHSNASVYMNKLHTASKSFLYITKMLSKRATMQFGQI